MKDPVNIVVPLDGSRSALTALTVARTLARLEHAQLHFIQVAPERPAARDLIERMDLQPADIDGALVEGLGGVAAEGSVPTAARRKSRFIVMCTRTGSRAHLLGHVAQAVIRAAPCPVVLVRPDRAALEWELHRVLLPLDGNPLSASALRPAIDLATRAGATLLVVHVAAASRAEPEPGSFAAPRYVDQAQHEWPAWSREFIDRVICLCDLPRGTPLRLFLARGDIGAELVRIAAEQSADLVAVVWRGRLEGERAPTLKGLLSGAHCPVLVVRAD